MARNVHRSIYLTPDQDAMVTAAKPDGMSISDFLKHAITRGVERVQPLPVEKYDEWGLINQLIRDDGDHTWLGRVKSDFFSEAIPRAMVLAAETTGLRGTKLMGHVGRHIKPIDLEPAKAEEYTFVTAADVKNMHKHVVDAHVRRTLHTAAAEAANMLLVERDPESVVTKLSKELSVAVADDRGTDIKEALRDMGIEAKRDAEEDASGITVRYGWPGLDALLPRMGGGEVHVLAARTNVGKSLTIANIAHYNASVGNPVAIFSLEMRRSLVAERIVSVEAGVASRDIEGRVNLTSNQYLNACQVVGRLPIHIDDRPALSAQQISNAMASMLPKPRLAIVDYVGLMRHPSTDNLASAVGQSVKGLLEASKRMGIPIILLAQINRTGGAEDMKPQLIHLRESGDIEQDASTVLLGRMLDKGRKRTAWELAKNRIVPRFGEIVLERYGDSARLNEVEV